MRKEKNDSLILFCCLIIILPFDPVRESKKVKYGMDGPLIKETV